MQLSKITDSALSSMIDVKYEIECTSCFSCISSSHETSKKEFVKTLQEEGWMKCLVYDEEHFSCEICISNFKKGLI